MSNKNPRQMSDTQIQAAAKFFSVLSDPTRLKILHALQNGAKTVTELVKLTKLQQGSVSKQIGILFDTNLLQRERKGNFIEYSIADPLIFKLCELVCAKIHKDAAKILKDIR